MLPFEALDAKRLRRAIAFAVAAAVSAAAAPGRHPAYTFTSLMKPGLQPIVGDIDWMPDGKLALLTMVMKSHDHVSGPSDLLLLDGVLKGGPEAVTIRKYASGFYTPQGIRVVDGQVYVLDNRDGLLRLVDADGDGAAEGRTVIWSEGIQSADRKWSGGLAYKDGQFYVPISVRVITGGRSEAQQAPWRGVVAKIPREGGKAENFIGGLRNSNGIGWGPGGELFVTDNQGDWLPASKVVEARAGEFHGHAGTAFADKPMVQPVLWLPQGEVANSPSNTIILRNGPYKGQMLIGEVTQQRILRASLEKVRNRLQGCAFPFAWDMPAGVNRLLEAPDGSGVLIVAGVGGDGGWTFKEPWYDLERMTPTAVVPFEMFAVRSLGASTLEVEFTQPIAAADAVPSRFLVRQWRYQPTAAYGGPKLDNVALTVRSVSLSADGRKATLDLAGLAAGRVVHLKLEGLLSKAGEQPYAVDAFCTLNAFGPADAPVITGNLPARADAPWTYRFQGTEAWARPPLDGPFTLRLLAPDGRELGRSAARRDAEGWLAPVPPGGGEGAGVLLLEARNAREAARAKWIRP